MISIEKSPFMGSGEVDGCKIEIENPLVVISWLLRNAQIKRKEETLLPSEKEDLRYVEKGKDGTGDRTFKGIPRK